LPEETASTRPSPSCSLVGAGGHAVHRAHGGARLAHQRRRIVGREQEGEADPPVVRDGEVADHAGGEEVVLESGVLDPGERGAHPRVEGIGHVRPLPRA
jgi:hypothetical protein